MKGKTKFNTIKLKDVNNTVVTTRLSEEEFMKKYEARKSPNTVWEFNYMSVVIHA